MGRCLLLLGFAAPLALAACSSASQKAANLAGAAQQMYDNQRYADAVTIANLALRQRDDLVDVWLLLARSQSRLRNTSGAYAAYQRVSEFDRTNVEALSALAQISLLARRLDDVDRYARQLLTLNPDDQDAKLLMGHAMLLRNRPAEAIRTADEVLARTPDSDPAIVLKARAMLVEERFDDAIAILGKPSDPASISIDRLVTRVEILKKRGDGAALEQATGALADRLQDDLDRRFEYVRALYLNGKAERATAEAAKAMAAPATRVAADRLLRRTWAECGLSARFVAASTAGREPNLTLAVARYAIDEADPALAERLLSANATAAAPDRQALLALAYALQGKTAPALALANRLLAADPRDMHALLARGQVALTTGDTEAAIRDIAVAVGNDPRDFLARRLMADIYDARREPDRAIAVARSALSDNPDDARGLGLLVKILVRHNLRADAITAAGEFTRLQPESLLGWRMRKQFCEAGSSACSSKAEREVARLSGRGSVVSSARAAS